MSLWPAAPHDAAGATPFATRQPSGLHLRQIGVDDLASGREPDPGMAGDEVERVGQRPDAVRLTDDIGMQRDAQLKGSEKTYGGSPSIAGWPLPPLS
jgi:hypothetical protein